ncbi:MULTISPECIES: MFS transporter [unclassified Oceanispirochaeta]|uniref:MFS transporter n=1 Tax=unclassified Oceanispirochaeta TaxID=2635722 RepID=UPI001314BF85|nr:MULTISPECIES: MFS transporter [unclassified Oceanispirochaeta]MBF9018645.1 MFS transporter [Oceanispirochaeta sp. M2]NPD75082.1 MFS transporter [Oceanispirochaeta sp. M1]
MVRISSLVRRQFITFTLCWLAYALIYFGRVNLSVALPDIESDLGLSKAGLGLIGTIFFWIYGTGQLVNGRLGDSFPSRPFIFAGLFVTALANIFFGLAGSVPLMLLLWGINGYFQSMLWGPIIKTLSHWFSYKKRAAVAIGVSTSMVGGFLLAWGLSGHLVATSGWRSAFLVPGIVIGCFSLVWLIFLRERPEDLGLVSPNTHVARQEDSRKDSFIPLLLKSRLGLIVLACFAQGIIKDGISLWGPTFILEQWDLSMETTVKAILIIPLTNLGGMFLASWLNSLLENSERKAILLLLTLTIISLTSLILVGRSSLYFGLVFLALTSAFMYGANTLLLGVIPMNYARIGAVSTIAGFLDFSSYLAAGAASVITGLVVQTFGWNSMLLIWCFSACIGAAAIFIDIKRSPRQEKVATGKKMNAYE